MEFKHIDKVVRESGQAICLGETYDIISSLPEAEVTHVEVIALEPLKRVTYRQRASWKSIEVSGVESYCVSSAGTGARVTRVFEDFDDAWPWYGRWFVRLLVLTTPCSVDPDMQRLKEAVLNSSAA